LRGNGPELAVGKIVCLARNYAEHAKEMKGEVPQSPVLFLKPSTAVVAPGGALRLPDFSSEIHHEVELVVVVGRKARNVSSAEAMACVLGYGVGLDLTARDLQKRAKERGEPWAAAKGFDGSAPVSEIAAAEEVGDPGDLAIELRVNGELRQSGRTSQMIFKTAEIIAFVSTIFTLEPGDLLFTGTPSGVGPIRAGDVLEASIERVGAARWEVAR
jgi:2-keto-4-pentenoate hydratase/2-oxohepta-3-ene-1,7-dioic acid hydratase in catechol pathway